MQASLVRCVRPAHELARHYPQRHSDAGGCTVVSWKKLKRRLLRERVRLLRSRGAPAEIAGGMAVGLFVAVLPIILQMPVALALAELLRRVFRVRLSHVAAAAGVWFTNPLTSPPIYGLCYLLGRPFARMLLPASQHTGSAAGVLDLSLSAFSGAGALEAILGLVIGSVLLGIPLAWGGYHLTYGMVLRYHARRQTRRTRRVRGLAQALSLTQG